jgi:hypothetical protein
MKRPKHYTSFAGVLATAAELTRQCYDTSLTLGNAPRTDLLAASTNGLTFRVQVKSLSNPNWILIQKHFLESEPDSTIYFVMVLVPLEEHDQFRFFILTHQELLDAWSAAPKVKRSGKPIKPGFEGIGWPAVKSHENAWHKLPGWKRVDSAQTSDEGSL